MRNIYKYREEDLSRERQGDAMRGLSSQAQADEGMAKGEEQGV